MVMDQILKIRDLQVHIKASNRSSLIGMGCLGKQRSENVPNDIGHTHVMLT